MGGGGGVKRLSIGIWNYVNHFKRFYFYTYTKSEGLDDGEGRGLMHFHVCAPSHACQSTFAKLASKWDLETPNPPLRRNKKIRCIRQDQMQFFTWFMAISAAGGSLTWRLYILITLPPCLLPPRYLSSHRLPYITLHYGHILLSILFLDQIRQQNKIQFTDLTYCYYCTCIPVL